MALDGLRGSVGRGGARAGLLALPLHVLRSGGGSRPHQTPPLGSWTSASRPREMHGHDLFYLRGAECPQSLTRGRQACRSITEPQPQPKKCASFLSQCPGPWPLCHAVVELGTHRRLRCVHVKPSLCIHRVPPSLQAGVLSSLSQPQLRAPRTAVLLAHHLQFTESCFIFFKTPCRQTKVTSKPGSPAAASRGWLLAKFSGILNKGEDLGPSEFGRPQGEAG